MLYNGGGFRYTITKYADKTNRKALWISMKKLDELIHKKKDSEEVPSSPDNFDVIKEKIKAKPLNKKKLLRRTIITASMAVIFGLIACFTFLILEPLFSNLLYPQEEQEPITFPEEEEEILPEDLLTDEDEIGRAHV